MKKTRNILGILSILVALAAPAHAQSFLTNGLIAYFPFSGNANDATTNGHNGTLFGSAAFGPDRFGNSNSSLALPGTQGIGSGVDVSSLSNMAYLPVTYSAWFLISNYPPPPSSSSLTITTLIGREACGQQSDGALTLCTAASVSLTKGFDYFWGANGYNTTLTLPTNKWCQVVLTRLSQLEGG